jgi:2-hydroxychromene-2-carboxylate isomerase
MTDPELHCFYSLSSPWAYLGGPQLQDIVRRHRVRLKLRPYDFQAVVPRTGGIPLRPVPSRAAAITPSSSTAGAAISARR